MSSITIKNGRFADAQESRFQTAKHSQKCIAVPQEGRIVDDQESRTQVEKRSDMGSALLVGARFDIRNSFFKLQNVQIWTVPNCKGFY